MAFQITARTVLELGSELISSDIIAFYELIKNAFDAGTHDGATITFDVVLRRNAYLQLQRRVADNSPTLAAGDILAALNQDAPPELLAHARQIISDSRASRAELAVALENLYLLNRIVVGDSGCGMSAEDLTKSFLVIGTPSRKREVDKALARGDDTTPYLGEKGIGRLSAMRLGERLRVETARREDDRLNILEIDWAKFADVDAMLADVPLEVTFGSRKTDPTWSGTRIIISNLTEDWTHARVKKMAEYDFARLSDPFEDQKDRPRIALFWNGARANIPWMDNALLASAHASLTGSYSIVDGSPQISCTLVASKLGFDHPKETEMATVCGPDLISALVGTSQERPESALTSVGPFTFEIYWFNRRILSAIEGLGDLKVVRDLQERWSGILLFRDRFRVFPYGEDEDDWLGLDRKALRRSGYTLNKTQFVGRVKISRVANPMLVDQTNREGLRETPEQQVLIEVMQYVIQDQLFRFMKAMERQYKAQKIDLSGAKTEVDSLSKRAKSALSKLRRSTPGPEVEDLQQVLLEFTDFADRARQRIEEVEAESRQMIHMAGVGLMVEVIAHELARASENALQNIEALQKRNVPEDVKAKLASLRSQMKSLGKRIRILDPLSVSGRQTSETFSFDGLIDEVLEGHAAQFERHEIKVKVQKPEGPIQVRLVKGMVVQILENLISNSKYWLEMKGSRTSFEKRIDILLTQSPPSLIYEDNGPGIAAENKDKVFRPFFSLKEKSKRRGLGLFIARECAEQLGGTLELADSCDEAGRLHRFMLELPEGTVVR